MSILKRTILASVALGTLSVAWPLFATAKVAGDAPQAGQKEDATVVIVTATKRKENLQTVPASIDAVTGETLTKLNVQKFEDVQKLSPGLVLSSVDGRGQNVAMRGVTFNPDSGASPTVQVYWNETAISTSDAFRGLFDVSQIEVLRGAQGTLRGQTSPGGAITIATRRPSLYGFGGTFSDTIGSRGKLNAQMGLNVPIIEGKLAVRLSGLYDYNETGIHDIPNNRDSSDMAHGGRISVLFKPISNLEILLVHQQLNDLNVAYPITVGSPATGQGAGLPTLTVSDRSSMIDGQYQFARHSRLTSLNINWDVGDYRLSYIGGYQQAHEESFRDLDLNDVIPGWANEQDIYIRSKQISHELRFETSNATFWNWMVGAYYSRGEAGANYTQPLAYYFLAPYKPPLQTTLTGSSAPDNYGVSKAIFTDHRLALSPADSIDLGLRYQENTSRTRQYITVFGSTVSALPTNLEVRSSNGVTGSASYKHNFSSDVMGYVSYATGLRPGGAVGFVTATGLDPKFLIYKPETTQSLEAGFKARMFDKHVTFNGDIFQQKMHNYIDRANAIYVRVAAQSTEPNGSGPGGTYKADTTVQNFNTNGDAISRGVELSATWFIRANLNLQFAASYIDAHYRNAVLYCNDSNNDGVPDALGAYVQPGRQVSLCVSNRPLHDTFGNEPGKLNASLRSEYSHSLGRFDVFARSLVRYVPPAYNLSIDKRIKSYTPVDLYLGIRKPDQNWELSIWAQNLFNRTVDRGFYRGYLGGVSGGYSFSFQAPEERTVGATLNYHFGE